MNAKEKLQDEIINCHNEMFRFMTMDESISLENESLYDRLKEKSYKLESELQALRDKPESVTAEEGITANLPESFKELFRCLEDGCYEFNCYGNDGNDNQEKIDGKGLLIKWVSDAYFEAIQYSRQGEEQKPSDDDIEKWAIVECKQRNNPPYTENEQFFINGLVRGLMGGAEAMRDGKIPKS